MTQTIAQFDAEVSHDERSFADHATSLMAKCVVEWGDCFDECKSGTSNQEWRDALNAWSFAVELARSLCRAAAESEYAAFLACRRSYPATAIVRKY